MITPKLAIFTALLVLPRSTEAAMTFAEDFSGINRGPNLIVTGGAETTIDYAGANARFTGAEATGSTRAYLGTAATFDLAVAFTAEIDVFVPFTSGGNGVAFFGFGAGQVGSSTSNDGGPSYFEPSFGPTSYMAVISNDFPNPASRGKLAIADFDSDTSGGLATVLPDSGPVGSGSHKLQMTYNGAGSLQFAYKAQGSTGSGDPWIIASTVNISDNMFTNFNGRVFFGGSGDVTFDNLSVVVVPEPSISAMISFFACGLLLRRGRR